MMLDSTDRLVIDEALQEIENEPPPRDWAPFGCGLGFGGFVLLVGFSVAARFLGSSRGLAVGVLSAGALLLVTGVVLWMASAGLARGRFQAAVEAALRELEQGTEDREVALRAATLLLTHAYSQHGSTVTRSFGAVAAAARLGDALPLVRQVEAYLLDQAAIHPVFTRDDST